MMCNFFFTLLSVLLFSFKAFSYQISAEQQFELLGGGSGGDILTCHFSDADNPNSQPFDIEYNSSSKTIKYFDMDFSNPNPEDKTLAESGQWLPVLEKQQSLENFQPQMGQKFELMNDKQEVLIEVTLDYNAQKQFPYKIYPFTAVYLANNQSGLCESTSAPAIDPSSLYNNLK